MKVTNLMEDFVKVQVDDMYNRLKDEKLNFNVCSCENCRADTVCYVLNRVPPKYIISARGMSHAQREFDTLKQLSADVDAVIMDGIRVIGSSKRPHHSSSYTSEVELADVECPYYTFPVFSGYAYDGTTFESLSNAEVTLLLNNENAKMLDSTWQNPYKTFKAMEGSYNFCVYPEKAEAANVKKDFTFTVKIEAPNYDPITYSFKISVTSRMLKRHNISSSYTQKIQDLFLFPQGLENPMERYPVSEEGEI